MFNFINKTIIILHKENSNVNYDGNALIALKVI